VAITAGGVHLPVHRIEGKRARQAGLTRGFEALRVPGWDEDGLTMAVEAGLHLPDEALEGLDRIRVFLEDPSEQVGLAARALDVDVPVTQTTGRTGLVTELATDARGEELWLAAGHAIGGAGVAVRVSPDEGACLTGAASVEAAPLGGGDEAALQRAFAELDPDETVPRLAPPATASTASEGAVGWSVGRAGPAGAGLEILERLTEAEGPVLVGDVGDGQAHVVRLEGPAIAVDGLATPTEELAVDAYRRREQAEAEPWSEASQGAYVSREVYDADPERRYGARARGGGEVAATTTIEAGPPGEFARQHDADGPYDVVIVSLDEGGREIGQAALEGELSIGDRVRPVLRRLFSMEGQTRYGLKWRPVG
jgi:hypothetical protein